MEDELANDSAQEGVAQIPRWQEDAQTDTLRLS
jgi:hypothetical protein